VKCKVKHNGDMGIGHLWLIMGGAFMAYNGWGIYGLRVWLWLKWVGKLWQQAAVSFGNMLKNAGLQGHTLSDHRMTRGLGPFELPW